MRSWPAQLKVNEVGFIFSFCCCINSNSPVMIIVVVLPESTIAHNLYPPTNMLMQGIFALIDCSTAMSCVVPVRPTLNFCFSLFPKDFAPLIKIWMCTQIFHKCFGLLLCKCIHNHSDIHFSYKFLRKSASSALSMYSGARSLP